MQNYSKAVVYDPVNGRGRVYVVTPGFFRQALDADTGDPIDNFGNGGTVDLRAPSAEPDANDPSALVALALPGD